MRLTLHRSALRFRTPLRTAYGLLRSRELVRVALTDDSGLVGWGEAAPLEAYDGVSIERVMRALRAYAAVAADPPAGLLLLDACRASGPTAARTAATRARSSSAPVPTLSLTVS